MRLFTISTHRAYLNTDITIEWLYSNSDKKTYCLSYSHKYGKNSVELKLSPHNKKTIKIKEAGCFVFSANCNGIKQEENVLVENAIKFGGSSLKNAFVFDDNPWVFITTKDRLYATNTETGEEKVEFGLTPEKIITLGRYSCAPNEYFLFETKVIILYLTLIQERW